MPQPEGCGRETSYVGEALPAEARQGSPSSCSGGSGAGGARERSSEEEAAKGRGRLLVFGAGGGSHSCRCTSGRHFVRRGSERDTQDPSPSSSSSSPFSPPAPPLGTDSPCPGRPSPPSCAHTLGGSGGGPLAALPLGHLPLSPPRSAARNRFGAARPVLML